MSLPTVPVITGQTATGKTQYALDYAQKHNGVLVNIDSRQMYRYLTLMTGKDIPSNASFTHVHTINSLHIGYYNVGGIFVWLYDVVDPASYISPFDYRCCVEWVMSYLQTTEQVPVFVGGTYWYIYYLLHGSDTAYVEPNWPLREKLTSYSVDKLQELLHREDDVLFHTLNESDRKNPRRLIRKIEIARNVSLIQRKDPLIAAYPYIGLHHASRDDLLCSVTQRVCRRIEYGAIEEVKVLLDKGYARESPGLRTIGYSYLVDYLEGKTSYEDAVRAWIVREMQYAKRQYTFMKKDKNIVWKVAKK